jgi:hypothetical protein
MQPSQRCIAFGRIKAVAFDDEAAAAFEATKKFCILHAFSGYPLFDVEFWTGLLWPAF